MHEDREFGETAELWVKYRLPDLCGISRVVATRGVHPLRGALGEWRTIHFCVLFLCQVSDLSYLSPFCDDPQMWLPMVEQSQHA